MADAKLEIILAAKDQTKGAFSSVQRELGGLQGNVGKAGSALGSMAATTAKAAVVVGGTLVAGLAGAVKSAASFESSLSEIQAVSGATGDEMNSLRALALRMGKDTSFSAKEAASGIGELAKAGVSTADIMGGALQGSLALAAAGGVDVGQAAEVAATAMNIFGKSGSEVTHVADLFASGANKSATSVEELAQSFNQSALVADQAGISIEELTGALALFAQNGLKGSDAGTSLKTALLALQNPTDKSRELMEQLGINVFDNQGRFIGLAGVADELQDALAGMSQEQRNAALATIFGSDAVRVAAILYQEGGEGVREWTAAVDDAGAAQRVAATRLDNLAGAWEQFTGTIETGVIELGTRFLPVMRRATEAAQGLLEEFLNSPDAQRAIQDLADRAGKALDTIVAKLKDPAFRSELQEWGTAALDVGRAVVSLAGDVKDTLGPPLKAAAGWFSSLDEDGRKNVVMFGLVAASAIKFKDELHTLLSVGNSVIDMFARKAVAKAALTAANEKLAGSAGRTATAFGAVRVAAAAAAPEIAAGAAITAGSVAAAGAYTQGLAELANAMDQEGNRGRELVLTRQALALAAQQGAAADSEHANQFLRLVLAQSNNIATTDQLIALWNQYVATMAPAIGNTEGLTAALTSQQQAQLAVNQVLGEGLIAGNQFNDTIGMMGGAARALAATLPPVGAGFSAAAAAAGELAVPVRASALALADINTYGTPAQTRLNEIAGEALRLALNADDLGGTLGGLIGTFDSLTEQMKLIGSESSQLGGWLQTLQGEWDALDEAVKEQGFTTAEQAKRYQELAPLIQYLNATSGELRSEMVSLTEQQVKNWMAVDTAREKYGEASAAAKGAEAGARLYGKALDVASGAAKEGAGASDTQTTAINGTAAAAATAAGAVGGLAAAIRAVPTDFTVTAHVDISGALAAIDTLNRNLPHSPAEEGPLSELPNWAALFEGLPSEAAKAGADAAKAIADAITAVIGASKALAGFSGSTPTGAQLGWLKDTTVAIVRTFQEAAAAFEEEGLKAAGDFADAASKVGGSIKGALDGLAALASADWAETSPSGSALGWFTHLASSLVQNFATAAQAFKDDALESAGQLGEAVGKVGGSIKSAVEGLAALASADWANTSPTGSAMGWFTHLVASLVANFAEAARGFEEGALEAAGSFADSAGKVANVVGPAVAGFAALATLTAPSETAIDQLMAGIKYLVRRFAEMATMLEDEGTKHLADFADAANKSLAAAKTGTDLFKSFEKLGIPSAEAIDNLMIAIRYVVNRFHEMSSMLTEEGLTQLQDFADSAGKALAAAKAGTDLFKDMEKLAVPSEQAIDYLLGTIGSIISKTRQIAQGIGEQGLREAQAFATGSFNVVSTLAGSLELFTELDKFKDIPGEKLGALHTALEGALDFARKLFQRAEAIKADAAAFANSMREAARLFAEGMSLGQGLPSGSPLAMAPAGVGGGATLGTGGGGGIGGAPVYNVNLYGDNYGMPEFENRVVDAISTANRRGRL